MRSTRLFTVAAVFLAAVMCAAPAVAAEGDEWQFDLAPFYLWGVSIDGDVGIGPVDQQVSADFGDIVDNLQGILTAHFEAKKGSWGGIFDIAYLDLGDSGDLPMGGSVDVSVKNTMVELDGFYRYESGAHAFDALAGFRYTKQDTKITLSRALRGQVDADWWDPLVGGRWIWTLAPGWQLTARGDFGGFGVGSDSTWNAAALVIWQPWKNVALAAGYRVLDQDYEDGEGADRYKWDATMQGPLAGIDIRW